MVDRRLWPRFRSWIRRGGATASRCCRLWMSAEPLCTRSSAERAASVTSSATGWRGIVLVLRERSELRATVSSSSSDRNRECKTNYVHMPKRSLCLLPTASAEKVMRSVVSVRLFPLYIFETTGLWSRCFACVSDMTTAQRGTDWKSWSMQNVCMCYTSMYCCILCVLNDGGSSRFPFCGEACVTWRSG